MVEQKNIYQRLNAVREAVPYIRKDKEVQGYQAVTHDAVTAAVRDKLIEHGVMIVPRQTASEVENVGATKNGTPIIRYAAWYEVDFINCDDPQDKVTVVQEAHANDSGDKAPGKTCSYAVKYAILKLLSIETGEDEESRLDVYNKQAAEEKRMSDLLTSIRDHIPTLHTIKTNIAGGKLDVAAEAWFELSDDEKTSLWVAPTKGGPFTVKEREVMKSSEFRKAYYGEAA